MTDLPILSIVIFLPVLGAVLVPFLRGDNAVRWFTLGILVADFLIASGLLVSFDSSTADMQFRENLEWVPSLGIGYKLGVDGVSVLFVFLTALLGWICVLASWTAITVRVKEFMINLLAMQALMIGVFCALDLFLFYVWWEAMLVPMYLIIGIWGGKNRIYAAFKFFLYTLLGSLLFLIGILVFSGRYAQLTLEKQTSPSLTRARGTASESSTRGFASRMSRMRRALAAPRWKIVITQPSATIGQIKSS